MRDVERTVAKSPAEVRVLCIGDWFIEGYGVCAAQAAFFQTLQGPLITYPTLPFQRSTYAMRYFQRFPAIRLMNGHSARSTPLWNEIMRLRGKKAEPTEIQLETAEDAGVAFGVVRA